VIFEFHTFLASVLDKGMWLSSRPGKFKPRKHPAYLLSRMLGTDDVLDPVLKRKIYRPLRRKRVRFQYRSVTSLVTICPTLSMQGNTSETKLFSPMGHIGVGSQDIALDGLSY
jgi:hypothetical protein